MSIELVSIFLPTYNRREGGFLERSINSVLAQTHTEFELIIVDDGSIDGSSDIINNYCKKDTRIRHERLEINTGLPALNTGLVYPKSYGSYLAWTFDDCELVNDHISTLLSEFEKKPEIGMSYGKGIMYAWSGDKETQVEIGKPYDKVQMDLGNNHIPNPCVMLRREVIENVGWYDPHIIVKRNCDWDLWRRIHSRYKMSFINKVISYERGCQLVNDSLGNNFTVFSDLVLKYSRTYRDDILKPLSLREYNPFRKDLGPSFTSVDMMNLDFLIIENYLKTLDIGEFINNSFNNIKLSSGSMENLWYRVVTKNPHLKDSELCVLFHGMMIYYESKLEKVKTERNKFEGLYYSLNNTLNKMKRK